MGMIIVRHKVRDYWQWRPIIDGHAEKVLASASFLSKVPYIAPQWSDASVRASR